MNLSGIEFDMQIKEMQRGFFDRARVKAMIGGVMTRAFARFGAFVMRRAQWSIHERDGPSAPYSPPHSHTGLLKKFIFFAYDPASESVVIGPARLSKRGDAPRVLEYGGVSENRQGKAIYIDPRPYMGPAFESTMDKWPGILAESAQGGSAQYAAAA